MKKVLLALAMTTGLALLGTATAAQAPPTEAQPAAAAPAAAPAAAAAVPITDADLKGVEAPKRTTGPKATPAAR